MGDVRSGGELLVSGGVTAGGAVTGAGPYTDASDARLKTDIVRVTGTEALDAILRLSAVWYRWKGDPNANVNTDSTDSDGNDGGDDGVDVHRDASPSGENRAGQVRAGNRRELGFLAQEVQAVVPELVHTAEWKHWPKIWPESLESDIGAGEGEKRHKQSSEDSSHRSARGSNEGTSTLTLAYSRVVPLVVEAIKSQESKIREQQAVIQKLREQQQEREEQQSNWKQLKQELKQELREEGMCGMCLLIFGAFCFGYWVSRARLQPIQPATSPKSIASM